MTSYAGRKKRNDVCLELQVEAVKLIGSWCDDVPVTFFFDPWHLFIDTLDQNLESRPWEKKKN